MSTNRKILIFVEGRSDKIIIQSIISRSAKEMQGNIIVMACDFFTERRVNQQSVKKEIWKNVEYYCRRAYLDPGEDIAEIIQITDTDGCFIDSSLAMYDEEATSFRYEEDGIYSYAPEKVIQRNLAKSGNIYRVYNCGSINGIPFKLYYMSCNLDHVLYDNRNMEDMEKVPASKKKAREIHKNPSATIQFLASVPIRLGNDYKSSWEEIFLRNESLQRHSNLSYFLDELEN